MNSFLKETQLVVVRLIEEENLNIFPYENTFISDYIRTFTWDKKLEMLLKSRGGKMKIMNFTN